MTGDARGEKKRSEGDVRGGGRSEWEWRIRAECEGRGERESVCGGEM